MVRKKEIYAFPQGVIKKVKSKQSSPEFELGSLSPFPKTITDTPNTSKKKEEKIKDDKEIRGWRLQRNKREVKTNGN